MKKIFWAIFLFFIMLAFIMPVNAGYGKNKISYRDFQWRLYETEHFSLYYYIGAEPLIKEVADIAEAAYSHHKRVLSFDLSDRVPFVMYRNKREFQQTNIILSEISEGIGGFSEILHNRMVLPVDGSKREVRTLIYHELTHIYQYEVIFHNVVGQAFQRVPDWFMEGMAAHMEGTWDSFGLMVLRDAVLNGHFPSLMDLHSFGQISNPFMGYRLGQSAVDFLVEKWGYEGLRRLLWEMSKSKTKDMKIMVKKALNISYRDFSDQWQAHVKEKFWAVGTRTESPKTAGKLIETSDLRKAVWTQFLQPSLSPSGDLLAVLSTERLELDVNILMAKSGEVISNLTKNYQGVKYENILGYGRDDGRNLAWSPDARSLALVVKREGQNEIFLINALSGKVIDIIQLDLTNVSSPTFTPDGLTIAFAAYDETGQSDIFLYHMSDSSITRVTNDPYIDEFPALAPDGKRLVYCSEREDIFQLVLVHPLPEGAPLLLTNADYDHYTPAWSADNQKIIFIGNKDSIDNIFEIDLKGMEMRQLTNTYTGYAYPQYSPDGEKIYFETYYNANMFVGNMDYPELDFDRISEYRLPAPPVERMVTAHNKEPRGEQDQTQDKNYTHEESDLLAFINHGTIDTKIEGKKVDFKFLPDAGLVEAGVRSDGLYAVNGYLYFSDILGNHRFVVGLTTIQNESSIVMTYFNLKHRFNYGFNAFQYKDFTYYVLDNDLKRFEVSQYGGSAFIDYPFDRYHRAEFSVTRYQYSHDAYPVWDFENGEYVLVGDVVHQHLPISLFFVRDTVRYRYFGPYMGSTFRIGAVKGAKLSRSYLDYLDYHYDLRAYQRISPRTLLAARLFGIYSTGKDKPVYSIGGGTTLRGYKYNELVGNNVAVMNLEFRFPLIDIILIPFLGAFTNVRGAFYWDFGAAWFDEEDPTFWEHTAEDGFHFVDLKSSQGFGIYWNLGYFELRFDWARKTNFNEFQGDWVYAFTIGRSF
ncbi:BamA/TamA family outer membrane protein [candidate division CSSED10-310 bacterium]|uniref:BamA/TamA family outer membrane protein n=1 Tax=candidate division CSSED10-310 bacterium TaxID=2855610 RepID=A0ABV6Z078_UNCC1